MTDKTARCAHENTTEVGQEFSTRWCVSCGAIKLDADGAAGSAAGWVLPTWAIQFPPWALAELERMQALLRRAVGVVSDVGRLDGEVRAVLDAFAGCDTTKKAVARTAARLAQKGKSRENSFSVGDAVGVPAVVTEVFPFDDTARVRYVAGGIERTTVILHASELLRVSAPSGSEAGK